MIFCVFVVFEDIARVSGALDDECTTSSQLFMITPTKMNAILC